jgi:D-mannonate dehydratase
MMFTKERGYQLELPAWKAKLAELQAKLGLSDSYDEIKYNPTTGMFGLGVFPCCAEVIVPMKVHGEDGQRHAPAGWELVNAY